jgi:hypothetical protein
MDDGRIQEIREEVLSRLRKDAGGPTPELSARVAALEAAVAELLRARLASPSVATSVHVHTHPGLRVIGPAPAGDRCVMEPDRPCVQSQACRVLGH